jgi:hypothetical protein
LIEAGYLTGAEAKQLWTTYEEEGFKAAELARKEPGPTGETIWDNVYADDTDPDWRKF